MILLRLAIALALGFLIGFERAWQVRGQASDEHAAGARTFPLIALLGAIAMQLPQAVVPWLLAALTIVIGAVAIAGYWRNLESPQDFGVSSAVAQLVALSLGAMAGMGLLVPAVASAVVVTLLLSLKQEFESLVQHIDRKEMQATMRLLLIALVLLPIIPNQAMGPFDALNPHKIWLTVVVLAGISYLGYFAIRLEGAERGIFLTGFLGGIASSTAVAVKLAKIARDKPELQKIYTLGIAIASGTMFLRMWVISALIVPKLTLVLSFALLPAAFGSYAVVWIMARSRIRKGDVLPSGREVAPTNPLDLVSALKLGAALTMFSMVLRIVEEYSSETGLIVTAFIAGMSDVEPVMLSMGSMTGQGLVANHTALLAICVAALGSSLMKPLLVLGIAGPKMAMRLAIDLSVAVILGAIGLWLGLNYILVQ